MQEEIYYYQWLQSCLDLPGKVQRAILERYPDPAEILKVPQETWEKDLTQNQARILWEHIQRTKGVQGMRDQFEELDRKGIRFASLPQKEYPSLLREIPDAPLGIYYKGKLPMDNRLTVAVIGSRDCSEYGSYVAKSLGRRLGEQGIAVVSGMARGIDGISQQAALEAGGESFGVLGCGVDICYPQSNYKLYQALMERGGILSTYPPGTKPINRFFPPRNRIVSGLSMVLVVVEAAVKSGTSITVSMALEQGREVFVVPGRVTDRLSEGCNRLIKQGAEVITDLDGFMEELEESYFLHHIRPAGTGKKRTSNAKREGRQEIKHKEGEGGTEENEILKLLDQTPKSLEEIFGSLPQCDSIQNCTVQLMELVMEGRVRQVSSGYFCRN